MSAAIEANNLTKSYKKTSVLKGVSFEVEKGTIFALLGANGAGKTTTINILTTLLGADDGTAKVNGHDVAKEAGKVRQSISLTGQFAAIDEVLTGRENLVLIGELRHVDNPEHIAEQLLQQFGLADAADRRTATYSGGMRRRLDIAMSLIGNPSIIFFDEPTTGLDPESRNAMWETIQSLADSGTTVFLTTQYLEEADKLADKVAILAKGQIVAEGTAKELKKLVPGSTITLTFANSEQLQAAAKLLGQYKITANTKALSLAVMTDGSLSHVAHIFSLLESENVSVAEFSQKVPTLDDVFFKIINDHKEATS
ncbi:MAG: ATP-binding cassette domain-containing protein [Actinobacteria bacterium]|jgi:ABC-2 type transport system ATP-binding protein|nr:MAG: ATP-binding cassette domain-containing protein [Actinomycetota bacterium]